MATRKQEAAPTATVDTVAAAGDTEAAKQKAEEAEQAAMKALVEEAQKANMQVRRKAKARIDNILKESGCAIVFTDADIRDGAIVASVWTVVKL